MATAAYQRWDAAGRPWRLARPVAELAVWARRRGVEIIGHIGDQGHLEADPPEDHTPYSATAYPDPLTEYVVCAIDLADVHGLGAAILRDARAGRTPWLKYLNFGGMQYTWRDRFRAGRPNPDQHVHVSVFSNHIDSSIGDYDPLERDMQLNDAVEMPDWAMKKWGHQASSGMADGKLSVGTLLGSGYSHARDGKEQAYRNGARLAELLAGQRAIAEQLAGGDGATLRTLMREELGRFREELGEQLAAAFLPRMIEQLGEQLPAELREQLGTITADALRAVLGSLDEQAS